MSKHIVRLNPENLPDAGKIGYSQISIITPRKTAFISGQVAIPANGEPVPTCIVRQVEIAGENVKSALHSIGATVNDVIQVRLYVVDLTPERLDLIMPAFLAIFDGVQPSLTGIGISALASPEFQVEIELTAQVPD